MFARDSPARLLTRHFVRRFVDNDLLSAHADRHESLGFFAATLMAAGLFAAWIIGQKYVFGIPTVGLLAVMTMEDRFTFISAGMIVAALIAVTQWDVLSIDTRDAAILGPLPLRHGAIVAAKAAANAIFVLAIVAIVAVPPGVFFGLLALSPSPLAIRAAVWVTVAHVTATALATMCAFLAVVAVREILRLLAGDRAFARLSTAVQSLFVVVLTTLLLLEVGGWPDVTTTWLTAEGARNAVTPFAVPPMWFLGLAEALSGDAIVLAPDFFGLVVDDDASRFYRAHQPLFARLAGVSVVASAGTLLLGGTAFLWNSRRFPQPTPAAARNRRLRTIGASIGGRLAPQPVARAGFFFTRRVLFRSAPHRLPLAVGMAAAISLAVAIAGGTGLTPAGDPGAVPLPLWALQPLILLVLLAVFRHATAVPAELRANWVFHQCWPGRLRAYLAGVERAALLSLMVPALLLLLPIHLVVLGTPAALFRLTSGLLLATILLSASIGRATAPPFVRSYVRPGNLKSIGPILVMAVLGTAFSLAATERAAAARPAGMLLYGVTLIGAIGLVRFVAAGQERGEAPLPDDVPEPVAQTLGLSE